MAKKISIFGQWLVTRPFHGRAGDVIHPSAAVGKGSG